MPHIVIECSQNLRARTDLPALVDTIHRAALATGVFSEGAIRTRVAERADYKIADGDPSNAFVHVAMRIGHGRDAATRRRAADAVFAALCDRLEPVYAASPLALSLELEEIDPEMSLRKNNIHDCAERRKAALA